MNKKFLNNKKKAFTLIELLIVIAIIGILFIVLVSKVDFATDKAKASGVQTDFRSFQVAFDTVAKENAGFNTFGYNTGDTKREDFDTALAGYTYTNENSDKGDGKRNSYDEGDKNLNGKQDVNGVDGYTGTTEVFTGRKIYTETWTEVYALVKPGTTGLDATAVFALESAINANLDPKLHITINADGTIAMANQARDPWKNEYHGVYISNAERDNGADRGAIIMYSNGANGKWGSAHDITNGVVTVTVPSNNVNGKDDYSLVSCYTFTNGYGEVKNVTTGFSNNQGFLADGNHIVGTTGIPNNSQVVTPPVTDGSRVEYEMLSAPNAPATGYENIVFRSAASVEKFKFVKLDGNVLSNSYYEVTSGSTVITLKSSYIQKLSNGSHTFEIVSEDGSAAATFQVEKNLIIKNYVFTMIEDPTMSFVLNDNGGFDVYVNYVNTMTIPSQCVGIWGTEITISGTGMFDGTFTLTDNGTLTIDGETVATAELGLLNKDGKFVCKNIAYNIINSTGMALVVDDEFQILIYDMNGNLTNVIPSVCVSINAMSITISGTNDFDGTFFLSHDQSTLFTTFDEEQIVVAVKDGQCTHRGFSTTNHQWYCWYDSDMNYVSLETRPSLELLKTLTLRCDTCLEEIPTRIIGNYIYLYNTYMEPFIINGEHTDTICPDMNYIDINGWSAVAYDGVYSDGLLSAIDGKPVTMVFAGEGVVLPNTIIYFWDVYPSEESKADNVLEYTYLGTIEEFSKIQLQYSWHETFVELMTRYVNNGFHCPVTIHCSDGDIIID